MLLRRILRSVARRACFVNTSSSISARSLYTGRGGRNMLQSFEEQVFLRTGKNHISTLDHNEIDSKINNTTGDAEYEEAIAALNSLQSNAATLRLAIGANNKQMPLDTMLRYVQSSGLTLEEVEKLSFIHVSGSKGKGSTCALTEAILRAHGVKTGFFSSPHLVSVTERIRINGEPISKQTFTDAFWRVYKRLQAAQLNPTDMPAYFRFLTILSFHIFLEQQVGVVILEVGIGGELDCTNIVRNTKTVGITSLGLEHTQLLGDTLPQIAWQKAGIIKPHANVYTAVNQLECLEVIRQRAAEKNATVHIVPEFSKYFHDDKSQSLLTNLNNVTQLNASLAIQLAYDWLRNHKNGFHRDYAANTTQLPENVLAALSNCIWPGRCQVVKYFNFNIYLEGAHTPESMGICSDWFHNAIKDSPNPKVLIFNSTADRDSRKLLDILRQKNQFDAACFVPNIAVGSANKSDNVSVLYSNSEQFKRVKTHAGNWHLLCTEAGESDESQLFSSILDSFYFIENRYGVAQEIDVLVTGSLHLIGATVLALNEYKRTLIKT